MPATMRSTFVVLALVATLVAGCIAPRAPTPSAPTLVQDLTCFVVNGPPGDEAPMPLEGEVWHDGTLADSKAALVLVTTGVGERHYWDGDTPGLGRANGTTLPRVLAAAGYAVMPYDRLGQGGSPYRGNDAAATGNVNIEQASAVVEHVRAGTYTMGGCDGGPGPAFERVFLGGHSYGGLIAMGVGVRKGHIDGLLVLEVNHYPSAKLAEVLARCTATNIAADPTSESTTIFCPGPDGYSVDCVEITTYEPGSSRELWESFCANEDIHPEPRGNLPDLATTFALGRPGPLGNIPLHFMFGEHDCAFHDGEECEDPTSDEKEVADWKGACGCKVTATTIPDIGHDYIHHYNQWMVGQDVLAWLEAQDAA